MSAWNTNNRKKLFFAFFRYYSQEKKWPRRIFSGIQPTGNVHLGNYFGAIKKWVDLQYSCRDTVIYSVVDLHSITLPQKPETLWKNIEELTATLVACGIDPERSILFQQSQVAQHSELSWILGTMATMARLSHLPQYKEKSESLKEIPLGLFVYPVLQAADILLYKATDVPVGEDQVQHLQMAQQLVKTFNHRFGKTFPTPKALIQGSYSARLRSLRDPLKKMSKSEQDPKSRINLLDSPDEILEKLKKAVTDCRSEVTFEPEERPGIANLITIHTLFTGQSENEVCKEARGIDTGLYKLRVAEAVVEGLRPIRTKANELLSDRNYLQSILRKGAEKAKSLAEPNLDEVKKKLGILPPYL